MYKESIVWFVKSVATIVQGWRHPWDHAHGHGHTGDHSKVHQTILVVLPLHAAENKQSQKLLG